MSFIVKAELDPISFDLAARPPMPDPGAAGSGGHTHSRAGVGMAAGGAAGGAAAGWELWEDVNDLFHINDADMVSGPEDPRALGCWGASYILVRPAESHPGPHPDPKLPRPQPV